MYHHALQINGKTEIENLGLFGTSVAAAQAYDNAWLLPKYRQHICRKRPLNFPRQPGGAISSCGKYVLPYPEKERQIKKARQEAAETKRAELNCISGLASPAGGCHGDILGARQRADGTVGPQFQMSALPDTDDDLYRCGALHCPHEEPLQWQVRINPIAR